MTINTTLLVLPAFWASYLINGDDSGLLPHDKELVDTFLADQATHYSTFSAIDVGDEFFAWSHDAMDIMPLGCTCAEFTFHAEPRPCL